MFKRFFPAFAAAAIAAVVATGCSENSEKSEKKASSEPGGARFTTAQVVAAVQLKQRISHARADMYSIRSAFAGLHRDYALMAAEDGSTCKLGGHRFVVTDGCITIGELSGDKYAPAKIDTYCNVIAELSDPGNASLTVSLNKRKIRYLDSRAEYDPSKSPTVAANKENTWLDPWGNPYMIRINVDRYEKIPDPSHPGKMLSSLAILWSLGPDGRGGTPETDRDNIPSWKDGSWAD